MKILPSVGLLGTGLGIGLVIGQMTSAAKPDSNSDAPGTSAARVTKRDRSMQGGPAANSMEAIRRAKPDAVAGLTELAVSESDPIERHGRIAECLRRMDAENWKSVMDSFYKLSIETGRDNAEAWKLGLMRSGQVAGEAAMNDLLSKGFNKKHQECWSTLYGWGMKNPRAALDWLKQAEAGGHQPVAANYTAIIAGAALSDPSLAMQLLESIPKSARTDSPGHLVWNLVQNGGVETLDAVLGYASTMDRSDPADAKFANDLMNQATDKLLWKADHALDVPQACEVVLKLTQYGQDPTLMTSRALEKYRWYGMPAKLKLLDDVNSSSGISELNLPALARQVLGTMNGEQDQVAVRNWLQENPDSPLVPIISPAVP